MKRLNIPIYQQPCAASCVNTCARMVCAYFGKELSHDEFCEYLPVKKDGVYLVDAARAVKRVIPGTKYMSFSILSDWYLKKWLDLGFPILGTDNETYEYGHCVLISGYSDDERFYVIDPNTATEYLIGVEDVIRAADEFVVIYK